MTHSHKPLSRAVCAVLLAAYASGCSPAIEGARGRDDKAKVEAAIAELEKSVNADDFEAIRKGQGVLTEALHGVAAKLYESAKAGKAAPSGNGEEAKAPAGEAGGKEQHSTGTGKDKVVDADFEVVDEKKK